MSRFHARIVGLTLAFCAVDLPAVAGLADRASDLCLKAAANASVETGVPYEILLAISVVETGRNGQPWPWTVNVGGEGHWLETLEDAETLVEQALRQGLTNVDLGCFQLNLYWHAGSFISIRDMLDPERNASYAAKFLTEKFGETGDWSAAAAAYHSATPEHAKSYEARFDATLASMSDFGTPPPIDLHEEVNQYPFLTAGQSGSPGSLVPLKAGGHRLIGEP